MDGSPPSACHMVKTSAAADAVPELETVGFAPLPGGFSIGTGGAEPPAHRRHVRERRHTGSTAATPRPRTAAAVAKTQPDVKLYLGPTNSGKTYKALQELTDLGEGVYAAPLRLLAWEAFEKLRAVLGDGAVGLVTGEERMNGEAKVLCCTAECAPTAGRLLVLDEVHWLADPERGSAWTLLLISGQFRSIRLCGAAEAEPLLRRIFANVEVERCARKSILTRGAPMRLDDVKARSDGRVTCIVCFSRKAVHGIAARAQRQGARVAVLYGALPPETRLNQMRAVTSGAVDVVVATDVIGHGINLPIDVLLFAEGSKFDGSSTRELLAWQGAQIAGRAGRGNAPGVVCALDDWSPPTQRQLDRFVALANGDEAALAQSDLKVDVAPLRPRLRTLFDLGGTSLFELPAALRKWKADVAHVARDAAHLSRRARRGAPDCVQPMDCSRIEQTLHELSSALDDYRDGIDTDADDTAKEVEQPADELDAREYADELTLRQYWSLATAPISERNFPAIAAGALRRVLELPTLAQIRIDKGSASALENHAQWIDDVIRAQQAINIAVIVAEGSGRNDGSSGGSDGVAAANEKTRCAELRAEVVQLLDIALIEELKHAGKCEQCGQPKRNQPWHRVCDECFGGGRRWYGGGGGWYDDDYFDDDDDKEDYDDGNDDSCSFESGGY